jgi:hypothetical protein
VAVLITAESIIAGFMIAYGAINGQLLVQWSHVDSSYMMTTYIAGIVIYTIVLTCFVSIVLLFDSLGTESTTEQEQDHLRAKYNAGYDLFLMAILGSAVFAFASGYSIYHITVTPGNVPIYCNSVPPLAEVLFGAFGVYAVSLPLLVLVPLILQRRRIIGCLEGKPHLLLKILVFVAFVFGVLYFLCLAQSCRFT